MLISRKHASAGFTIVELLIVIVIIAILATVTVVAYNDYTSRAIDTAVLSDAEQAAKSEGLYAYNNDGAVKTWYSSNGVDPDLGVKTSSGNIIDVATSTTEYCVRVYNPKSKAYRSLSAAYVRESTPNACNAISASVDAFSGSYVNTATTSFLAGSTAGLADGIGVNAQFNYPYGIVTDLTGTILLADGNNHRIRAVKSDGTTTTVVGSSCGNTDGPQLTTAKLCYPYGLAIDKNGILYVSDNQRIKKIVNGNVTTIAGSNTQSLIDGTGAAAAFSGPKGLATDSAGNIYVADSVNNAIRKVTPAGVVTTLAGNGSVGSADGTGSAARFNRPYGLAVDAANNVYVAEDLNNTIRKITPAGVVTTFAGTAGQSGITNGTGAAARFEGPRDIKIDPAGNLYVADARNNKIRKITPAGVVTDFAGSVGIEAGTAVGTGPKARFANPHALTIAPDGTIVVSDSENNRVMFLK